VMGGYNERVMGGYNERVMGESSMSKSPLKAQTKSEFMGTVGSMGGRKIS
jgi:hypothetical protein